MKLHLVNHQVYIRVIWAKRMSLVVSRGWNGSRSIDINTIMSAYGTVAVTFAQIVLL